jgi:hypothetical protein
MEGKRGEERHKEQKLIAGFYSYLLECRWRG